MKEEKKLEKAGFFSKQSLKARAKLYFVDAMGAMALGLFASLLIGTIFKTIGERVPYLQFWKTVAGFEFKSQFIGSQIFVRYIFQVHTATQLLFL